MPHAKDTGETTSAGGQCSLAKGQSGIAPRASAAAGMGAFNALVARSLLDMTEKRNKLSPTDAKLVENKEKIKQLWAESRALLLVNREGNDLKQKAIDRKLRRLQRSVNVTPASSLRGICANILALSASNPAFESKIDPAALLSIARDAERLST